MGCGGPEKPHLWTRCVMCRLQGSSCGPHCVFAPIFPPGSEVDFVLVVAMYGMDALTRNLTTLSPALRNMAATFMIEEAWARSIGCYQDRLFNAAFLLLIQVPRLLLQLLLLASVAKQLHHLLRAVATVAVLAAFDEAALVVEQLLGDPPE